MFTKWFPLITVGLIILLALGLRLTFAHTVQLYPDEFATLLAIQMISQHGTPTMPSGLFYDHGLLFSYLAYLTTFFGPARETGRYLSLGCGLATLGLTYLIGYRDFSPRVALIALTGLALAPTAVEWSGRVRMYALMQLFVMLTLGLAYQGLTQPRYRWAALLTYLGALLTHFVAITLAPALFLNEILRAYRARQPFSLAVHGGQLLTLGMVIGVGFMVKRLGQPKGIAALDTPNAAQGVWDVLAIYGNFSLNPVAGWLDMAPFFTAMPVLILSLFALVALMAEIKKGQRVPFSPTAYYGLILIITTLEMMVFVSPDRRNAKYLFMLLPSLLLLGAAGLDLLLTQLGPKLASWGAVASCLVIGAFSYAPLQALLANPGEDYDSAFAQVQANWQEGDTVLTGTPAAAYFYLQRNDFYSVQKAGGYDYRLLNHAGQAVDRWLASPAIRTPTELHEVLSQASVWLVLEQWGLQREYYDLPFLQDLLAQTQLVGTARGLVILRPKPHPRPLILEPRHVLTATFGQQLQLIGYTPEPLDNQTLRLTFYWRAITPLTHNYTVFVHYRHQTQNLAQADHVPLNDLYPMTMWPVGETLRETSELTLPPPPSSGELWMGVYLLETGERLSLADDTSGENALKLP